MIVPKLLRFVVEDHDACRDEGLKLSRVLTHELIRFGGIGVSVSLRRGCLLNDVIGIGHTPWLTLDAWGRSQRAWGARRAWRARWEIWVSTRGSWWARRIIQSRLVGPVVQVDCSEDHLVDHSEGHLVHQEVLRESSGAPHLD